MSRKFEYFDKNKRPENPIIKYDEDYINYEYKIVKKSTGPEPDDFELEEVIEEKKVNIKEHIESFADRVGVDAAIRRLVDTGDISVLNQSSGIHADLSIIPEDPEERFKMATGQANDIFNSLDPELTQGLSQEEFINGLTPEKLQAYINKKVEERLGKKEVIKDENN